jgi:hypothetical protein
VTIRFEVNASWLSLNGISSGRVYLYRYASEEWRRLETRKIGEDSAHADYEATSPGFSYFAIAGETGSQVLSCPTECCLGNPAYAGKPCQAGYNCVNSTCIMSGSPICGNGVTEAGEACDGPSLGDKDCVSLGFEGGALKCNNCAFDTSSCSGSESGASWTGMLVIIMIAAAAVSAMIYLYLKKPSLLGFMKRKSRSR